MNLLREATRPLLVVVCCQQRSRPCLLPPLQWRQRQRHEELADAHHRQEDPQAGPKLPTLPYEQFLALRDNIAVSGVLVPILVDDDGPGSRSSLETTGKPSQTSVGTSGRRSCIAG